MAVPKIIHQVWIGDEIPRDYVAAAMHLKQLHPDYEYMFWDESNAPKSRFPHIYDAFSYKQLKSDLIRYEILNEYGGIYCDLDIIWVRPMTPLIQNRSLVIAKENPIRSDHSLTNCFIACEQQSAFMAAVFDRIETAFERHKDEDLKEIHFGHRVTGPWMITELCREKFPEAWNEDMGIKTIFPSFYLKDGMHYLGDLPENSYAIHCVNHSGDLWGPMKKKRNTARRMIREIPAWGEVYDSKSPTSDLVRRLRS